MNGGTDVIMFLENWEVADAESCRGFMLNVLLGSQVVCELPFTRVAVSHDLRQITSQLANTPKKAPRGVLPGGALFI